MEEIYVEAGNMVKKGDPIIQLRNTNLRLEIMHQEASLLDQSNVLLNTQLQMEKQKIELSNQLADYDHLINRTKRIYGQNKKLLENKIISQQEFEKSKDDYFYNCRKKELAIESSQQDSIIMSIQIKQLEASLKRLQANLKIVQQQLENLTIKAPVTGQLTSLNAEYTGEIKSPGERIGQIDVLDGFKIRAGIDEHYLPRINLNQYGEFEFAGQSYRLIIKKIFPEIVGGRFNIDLEFVNIAPSDIRRGQTVHIRLELGDLSEATVLSRGGFYQKTGGQWVYVIDNSGEIAIKRSVKLGRQNTQVFEVLEGLEPGEKVITSSYDNFGDVEKLVLK
ncbi:HlyD family efflux transporter periplasmic adaptor subunit [bacterium]|nr:HlyD family efflux transporter periplasmic adaptor subunit [bacterium]MBU1634402.1 HlyD family efflux transporter periplasmic adaptor subunit [bacterium]MBU1873865.1 HlyD family efflux transporter periplasmic adaptor subunit [bacterium]